MQRHLVVTTADALECLESRNGRDARCAEILRAGDAELPSACGGGAVIGWETSERVLESGAFESRQGVLVAEPAVEASEAGARTLGITYWRAVDRFTHGGIRASWTGDGGRLKLSAVQRCSRSGRRSCRSTAGSSAAGTQSRVDCSRSEPAAL
jgi:hypothetical protein